MTTYGAAVRTLKQQVDPDDDAEDDRYTLGLYCGREWSKPTPEDVIMVGVAPLSKSR